MYDALENYDPFWRPLADLLEAYAADWLAQLSGYCSNMME